MITFSLLLILALAYIVLKTINMRARFEEADRQRMAEERAAEEAMEEAEEEAEIRASAIDVEAETIDNDEAEAQDAQDIDAGAEEIPVVEVTEFDTVK